MWVPDYGSKVAGDIGWQCVWAMVRQSVVLGELPPCAGNEHNEQYQ
jgi:hypothetical protein